MRTWQTHAKLIYPSVKTEFCDTKQVVRIMELDEFMRMDDSDIGHAVVSFLTSEQAMKEMAVCS